MKNILLLTILSSSLWAQTTQQLIDVSNYGWLDQYSINSKHNFIGNEACFPTSTTNGMTFLQNVCPTIFGTSLSGVTYSEWERTDDAFINLMSTLAVCPSSGPMQGNCNAGGTLNLPLVSGISFYLGQTLPFPQVQISGVFTSFQWGPVATNPKPSYIQIERPSIAFLSNAIAAGSAALVVISYPGGGGHGILANGLDWDSNTNTGTLYFVDPLDPSQNYSAGNPSAVLGPVKQTIGTLSLSGDIITLTYNQYCGGLNPYDPSAYSCTSMCGGVNPPQCVSAVIGGILSFGGSFYTPYAPLLTGANVRAIAEGFQKLDPTTSRMFPILAVLNPFTDPNPELESAFEQMDPSIFNAILFAEEAVAIQVQSTVHDNLLAYRKTCNTCHRAQPHYWLIPYAQEIHQKGAYKNPIVGITGGWEYDSSRSGVLGLAAAYADSHVKWEEDQARSHIHSYEGMLYMAWTACPWWADLSFAYVYNKVDAKREIFIPSSIPFIPSIDESISHHNHANVFATHFEMSYEIFKSDSCGLINQLWPFLSLDYVLVQQAAFTEDGNSPLAQTVHGKISNLLEPEIGLGWNLFKPYKQFTVSSYASISYLYQGRIGGKSTEAFFLDTPSSEFEVSGFFFKNHLFAAMVQLGIGNPTDTTRVNLNYHGNFGSSYISNGGSLEITFGY